MLKSKRNNKQNIYLKFHLIFIFLFACFAIHIASSNVFAWNLPYMVDVQRDKSATLRFYSGSLTEASESGSGYHEALGPAPNGEGWYHSYGFGVHGKSDRTYYDENDVNQYIYDQPHYDSYNGGIISSNSALGSFSVKPVQPVALNAKHGYDIWCDGGDENDVYNFAYEVFKNNGQWIHRNDWHLSTGLIDEIVKKYNKEEYRENENLKVKFSLPIHTAYRWDAYMDDAASAVSTMKSQGFMNKNWGGGATLGGSVINYYDNWLYIPLAKINNRKAYIYYWAKDENGKFVQVKSQEGIEFGSDAKTIIKESIGEKDRLYIGGKMSEGKTLADAKANANHTTNTWGWNQTSITIPASNDEKHYVINLYYDYRDVSEYHLKTNGSVINPALNKTAKELGYPRTRDVLTFKAIIPLYYKYEKYVHVSTDFDHNISKAKEIKLNALNGANSLVYGDKHYVKFFYEFEPPRQVYVRHFVYDEASRSYRREDILTNASESIRDGEEGKYYLRKNGYNQRHYKCGEPNYVDKIAAGFNEQYTIDFSDTMRVDKSRTIENEGKRYIYQGYKMQNNTVPKVLTSVSSADTLNKNNKIAFVNPEKVTKTYIDFYYKQEDVKVPGDPNPNGPNTPENPDPDKPTIDFVPEDEGGNQIGPDSGESKGECKVVYVPSGEKLKSYITAVTYRPYSLIYDGNTVDPNTGEIQYKLKKYDAYKYVDGYVQNTNGSKYGYFNSTGKNGVFHRDADTYVNPIRSNIDQEVKNSIGYFASLNPNEIEIVEDGRKTKATDYGADNVHQVNSEKYNGVRKPSGKAQYNVTSLINDGNQVFNVKKNLPLLETENNTQVNVFTPASIKDIIIESESTVNHSNQDTFVIQKNSEFKVTPVTDKATDYKNINDTAKYIKYYWLITDFDMKLKNNQIVFEKGSSSQRTAGVGEVIKAGTLLQIPVGGSLSAIATNDETTGDVINQFSNKLKVIAVTHNVTDMTFENAIAQTMSATTASSYIDKNKITKITTSCGVESNKQNHKKLTDLGGIEVNNMYDDAHYFVEQTKTSKNIGRIYDFKITDCLDVNFKNVFRKSDNGDVNDLRGIQYFSGLRRLLVYGGNGVQLGANQNNQNNIFDDREKTDTSINSVVSKTIAPFGPYKHIDKNYVQAPKLGYRVSFDVKTSGTYVKNKSAQEPVRYIKITPSYYYISKDGKTFKENIELYYKNSSGKYVNFAGSGYTIYFKPNDGYRTIYNKDSAPELKDMSTKLEALKIGGSKNDKSFVLKDNMMSYSDNNFVQAWYGEFKLPNSTIVVEVEENGKKDINKPLTDGYIGVRFDIQCVDKETANAPESDATKTTIVSYNQNDKTAEGEGLRHNTTQWDYEGYIGFESSNIGKPLASVFRIQLEKDFWIINTQEMYEKIRSTVVLFDLDNRAANDFE